MPRLGLAPRPMFMTRADMREWSSTQVMTVSATPITLTAQTTVHEDMLHFLMGYGSRSAATAQSLPALLAAGWTASVGAAGTMTAGIDSNDKVYLEAATDGGGPAIDWALTASTGLSQLGFTSATYGLIGGAAPFRRTAESNWTRGNLTNISITIDPTGAPASWSNVAIGLQNAVAWLRSDDEGDADDQNTSGTLEYALQQGLVLHRIRCGITTEGTDDGGTTIKAGRVFIVLYGGAAAPTWDSTTFRDRLGFSGSEALRTVGGQTWLIADYPCPGVWVPPYAPSRVTSWTDEETATLDLRSGGMSANHIARKTGWNVRCYAHGELSTDDHEWHLRDHLWKYAPKGYPLTLCFDNGDTRRQLAPQQVTSSQAGYTKLYTSQVRRGRIRGLRDGTDATRRAFEYDSDRYFRTAVDVVLRSRVD